MTRAETAKIAKAAKQEMDEAEVRVQNAECRMRKLPRPTGR